MQGIDITAHAPPARAAAPNRSTRILWLSHFLPFPPIGGVRQRSFTLLKHLDKNTHEVRLASLVQPAMHATPTSIAEAEESLRQYVDVLTPTPLTSSPAIRRHRIAIEAALRFRSYESLWLRSTEFRKVVESSFEYRPPDLTHFDTIGLCQFLGCLPRSAPAVLTHHNIESQMLLRRSSTSGSVAGRAYFSLESRRLRQFESSVAGRFARHIVCSDLDAERLSEIIHADRIAVVPNGVDTEYFTPNEMTIEEPDSLVFVGGLSWYPNASAVRYFLTEVWPLLKAKRRSLRFTIVGRHPPPWLMRAAAEDETINVTGFVPDMRPLVRRATVYICPIFDGGGTKVKMLDALALGKAIVAHPVACEGLNLVHGKNVMIADTPRDMCDAVLQLLDDFSLRRALSSSARETAVRDYSGPQVARALARAYQDALH